MPGSGRRALGMLAALLAATASARAEPQAAPAPTTSPSGPAPPATPPSATPATPGSVPEVAAPPTSDERAPAPAAPGPAMGAPPLTTPLAEAARPAPPLSPDVAARAAPRPVPRGRYVHDGIFARASVGPGLFFGWSGTSPDSRHYLGGTVSIDVSVGGAPARGVIIGAGYQTSRVLALSSSDAIVDGDEPSFDGVRFALDSLSLFVDYYPDPEGGLHFLASIGTGWLDVSRSNAPDGPSPSGLILSAGGGYEWFVGPNISLGLLARATLGVLSVRETFTTNSATDVTALVPALLATGTYN